MDGRFEIIEELVPPLDLCFGVVDLEGSRHHLDLGPKIWRGVEIDKHLQHLTHPTIFFGAYLSFSLLELNLK